MSTLHKEPWLTWIDPRQTRRTHELAKAVKRLDGTLVCHDGHFAKKVALQHDVKTVSINANLRGETGVLIYDHEVVRQLEAKAFRLERRLAEVTAIAQDMLTTMKARTQDILAAQGRGPDGD